MEFNRIPAHTLNNNMTEQKRHYFVERTKFHFTSRHVICMRFYEIPDATLFQTFHFANAQNGTTKILTIFSGVKLLFRCYLRTESNTDFGVDDTRIGTRLK